MPKKRYAYHPILIPLELLREEEEKHEEDVLVEENEDDYNVDFLINLEERIEDCS